MLILKVRPGLEDIVLQTVTGPVRLRFWWENGIKIGIDAPWEVQVKRQPVLESQPK